MKVNKMIRQWCQWATGSRPDLKGIDKDLREAINNAPASARAQHIRSGLAAINVDVTHFVEGYRW